MKVTAGGGSKDYGRIDEGTYASRIVQVVGLGKHPRDSRYPDTGECDKVLYTVEFPTETISIDGEDKPRIQSKTENMFLNDRSNLYKLIKAADPKADLSKEYDLENLLGKPLMTTIGSTNTNKPKIMSHSPMVKGLPIEDQINDSVLYDFYQHDESIFDKLMDWIKDNITDAINYEGDHTPEVKDDEDDQEVPF